MADLEERHKRHLLPGSFEDSDKEAQQIEILTASITKVAQQNATTELRTAHARIRIHTHTREQERDTHVRYDQKVI